MAQIELRDIDEQIQRLQELKKVMSDPAMAALLNQLLSSKNGRSIMPAVQTQSVYKAKKKGTFVGKVLKICKGFIPTESFTVRDVVEAYEQGGNTFEAKDKMVAAYSAMQRLVSRGELVIIEPGKGAKPTKYRLA